MLLSPAGNEAQAFRQGLRDVGYVEGRDVVIVADTTPATQAARRATSTIPIVMAIVADPVGSGLVAKSVAAWRKRHRAIDHAG